jgi:predicted class III extradiol MEMO1 family dioxygenase
MKMSTALRCICHMFAKYSNRKPNCQKRERYVISIVEVLNSQDIKIVPILVGSIDRSHEAKFGRVLAPYLAREDTFFVISSDFCHW